MGFQVRKLREAIREPRKMVQLSLILFCATLFGTLAGNNNPQGRAGMKEDRKSILDTVTNRTRKLMSDVGPSDRRKIDEYISSIRDIEGRIAITAGDQEAARGIEKPEGVPTAFVKHARLMTISC